VVEPTPYFLPKIAVAKIMLWRRGSTARRANPLQKRTGLPFWQDESYNHWVRSRKEFDRMIAYVEENPASALDTLVRRRRR